MKKTTLLKNLLKSPPISVKTFKSTQKYQFTSNDVHQTYTNQQTLKMRIEKINESLNHEIKQRQFEFKQLYKMVTDLQKSKKSKCKHSVIVMQRNQSPQQITHIPFTVLQNNFKQKITDQVSESNLSQKSPFSTSDFGQLSILKKENIEMNLMKKEKRKSKLGTIKSHKYLPTIYSSSQSIQMQNEEENEEDQKSNLQTTTSQFFSNSHSHFNFNFEQREIVSPTKSIISNSNIRKDKNTEEIDLKITYFENKLKSLEASHTFLKEKVDTSFLKQADITQQFKSINSKIENLSTSQPITRVNEQIKEKMKQVELDLNKKYKEISEETSNNFKNIQSLIYENQKEKMERDQEINDLSSKIQQLSNAQNELIYLKAQQDQNECKYQQMYEQSRKYQSEIIARIEALESAQGDLFKEFGDLVCLKDQKLEISKIKQSVSQNQSFVQPSFCSDKISEIELRLESTEEIVSELMKVSLTLTEKINKLTNFEDQGSKKLKPHKKESQKKPINKSGLSEGYWSLKQELNKIDEEPIESSRQIIDESFLYNEENQENSEAIKICDGQNKEPAIVQQ